MVARSTCRPRRICTALVRRFCSSSSSRKAYGRAVRISCASTDGSVVSAKCTRTTPRSMRSSRAVNPSASSASVRVSSMVWRTRRWSGISTGPVTFSWHAAAWGNTAAMRSSDSMRWIGGGLRLPLRNRSTMSDRLRFQRQRDDEHRRGEDRLFERLAHGAAVDVADHLVEREAVVRPEREHDGVVGRRGLQLEVEGATELLAQREAERAVHPAPERRVHHELHAAGVVEEAFDHQLVLGGHRAERGAPHREVVDDERRGVGGDARDLLEVVASGVGGAGLQVRVDRGAQRRHLGRELGGAGRGLTHPEGDGGRRVAGVAHAHGAELHLAHLPRVGAEQEDVAGHRLHGEVLVDRADEGVVGLGDHAVVAGLGDRPARGDRGEPRRLAAAQLVVHAVVVDVGPARAAARLDAVGDEGERVVELGAGELVVGRGAPEAGEQLVGGPLGGGGLGHDLLGEDVERFAGELEGVEPPGAHRGEQRGALDELVAGEGVETTLRRAGARVVGAADPLEEGGDAAG